MFNVCPACGMYSVEKEIRRLEGARAEAVCPACQYAHPFLRLPLFLVTGASGTGKSRLCLELAARDTRFIHLETDILWGAVPASPEDDYRSYRDTWLRVAKNVSQAGRPVVLYGSAVPSQFEGCPERRYFSHLHCLALVSQEETLIQRLKARPGWRESGQDAFLESMIHFNRWFLKNTASITLLDTSSASLADSAAQVLAWLSKGM